MPEDRPADRALADEVYLPQTPRSLRQLPGLAIGALKLVAQAARSWLILIVGLQALSGLLLALQVIAARAVLSRVLTSSHTGNFQTVVPWLIVLAAIFALNAHLAVIGVELQRLLSELVARHATLMVVQAASSVDLIRFEDPNFHDRLQRATVNATIRPFQMTTGILSLGTVVLSSLAVGATLATIEPLLLVLAVVAIVPVTMVSMGMGRTLYQFAVQQTPLDRQRTYLQHLLTQKEPAKEVRAYNLAPYLRGLFADLYRRRIRALRRLIRARMVRGVIGAGISGLAVGGTLGLLVLFISDGRISLAGAGAAAAGLLLLGTQLQGLSSGVGALYESALFIDDFNSFVVGAVTPDRETEEEERAPLTDAIEASSLYFTYPSRTEPSLNGVSINVKAGEVVALVGENGSGKTTLAKVMAGLYRPDGGRIVCDGLDIEGPGLMAHRSRCAVLFQDFIHYQLSAAENIILGRWSHPDRPVSVVEAARRAGADRFVDSLDLGYDTYLGPEYFGGVDLSVGQWQRLALARAFYRDAPFVILDEPTASLDPRAEAELFDRVRDLFRGRAVLLISHRFSSVRNADRIYVLDRGRVIEHGAHPDLMAAGGRYAELYQLQAAAFAETPGA